MLHSEDINSVAVKVSQSASLVLSSVQLVVEFSVLGFCSLASDRVALDSLPMSHRTWHQATHLAQCSF